MVGLVAGLAAVVGTAWLLPLREPEPVSVSASASSTSSAVERPSTTAPPVTVPATVPTSVVPRVDPSEPVSAGEIGAPPLPPRPPGVRSDAAGLASRFIAEWLTYPAGVEPPASLGSRLGELMTTRFRAVVEDLSTAGMEDRPGSAAVVGATTALPLGVFRVSAWQALEGGDSLAGPYSWDVTVVPDPRGGWLVDGLRRVG